MLVYGLDFTSAPNRNNPLNCVRCRLEGETLAVEGVLTLTRFEQLEECLAAAGPWIAGFDFPFGQPREFVQAAGWPWRWEDCVRHVAELSAADFAREIDEYRHGQPPGRKHLFRQVDRPAGAVSPMSLHRVPVARMFYQGAPRLMRSGVNIVPCRRNRDPRVAVEAYPALVARRWLGRRSYKASERARQTPELADARRELVEGLRSERLRDEFGFGLEINAGTAASLVDDPGGDRLDSLLCAIQAAWAHSRRDDGYGIPAGADPLEGWIADPSLAGVTPAA